MWALFWFLLLILSNAIWLLVYSVMKKIIASYEQIILESTGIEKSVLKQIDKNL